MGEDTSVQKGINESDEEQGRLGEREREARDCPSPSQHTATDLSEQLSMAKTQTPVSVAGSPEVRGWFCAQNHFWLCDPGKRHGFCAKLSFPILKMGIAPPEFIMPIIYYNLLNNYYFDGYIVCFQKGRERKKECGPGRGNFKYKGMLQGVQKTMFQS